MKEGIAILVLVVLIFALGVLIGASCSESVTKHNMAKDYCDRIESRSEYDACVKKIEEKGFKQ